MKHFLTQTFNAIIGPAAFLYFYFKTERRKERDRPFDLFVSIKWLWFVLFSPLIYIWFQLAGLFWWFSKKPDGEKQ